MNPDASLDERTLEGAEPDIRSPAERDAAIEQAFDYRGDVTLVLLDGRTVEGYVFDRRRRDQGATFRVMPSGDGGCLHLGYDDVRRIRFSGRDTAAGKSWEAWVRKYQEKKKQGQPANIEPDALE